MKKIGISCNKIVGKYGIERGFEIIKRAGFDAVDFNLERYHKADSVYYKSDDEFESFFEFVKDKAREYELIISQTHGLCATYLPDDSEREAIVNRLCELDLRAASLIGSPATVIHFINSTRWGVQPASVMREVSSRMFDTILPYAEKYKVKIAMETFGAARVSGARIRDFFADATEFKMQYDRLNTEYKTICVDTGHTHEVESFWVIPPEEMIRTLGKDVTLLHLHDNSGHWDDHLLPGMGNIKWGAVFDALDDIGYSGVYNFELSLGFGGSMLDEWVGFIGKYLRRFVDGHGKV